MSGKFGEIFMRFSQRIGITPIKVEFQLKSMDEDLQIVLWNAFQLFFLDPIKTDWLSYREEFLQFFRLVWHNFLKRPLDNLDDYYPNTRKTIRELFFEWKW